MKKYLILLFLIIAFLLNSQDSWIYDETMDFETFKEEICDNTDAYYEYVNEKQTRKDVIELCKIKFEFTRNKFDCCLWSIYKPFWRSIPKNRGAFEVEYEDPCYEILINKSWKGYKVDGMYYFFREYIYPGIFDDENFLEENKDNNFTVDVWHTAANGKIYQSSDLYVCKTRLLLDKENKKIKHKVLDFYRFYTKIIEFDETVDFITNKVVDLTIDEVTKNQVYLLEDETFDLISDRFEKRIRLEQENIEEHELSLIITQDKK